tara:strand:+ start:61 stop:207 length:147 start_codon:yes stop_codon:yes gene_type:complete
MSNRKIIHWTIKITWDDKEEEYISDIPEWIHTEDIEKYLDHLEEKDEE